MSNTGEPPQKLPKHSGITLTDARNETTTNPETLVASNPFLFETLPLVVQRKVVEKLELKNFIEFRLSSKLANDIGKTINVRQMCEIKAVKIQPAKITIYTSDRKCYDLETLKNSANCPRFCVTGDIVVFSLQLFVENKIDPCDLYGRNCKVTLWDHLHDVSPDQFAKFVDQFDVNYFSCPNKQFGVHTFNTNLLRREIFSKFEYIHFPFEVINAEEIFSWQTPSMHFVYTHHHEHLQEDINKVFKEWYPKQRRIGVIHVHSTDCMRLPPKLAFVSLPAILRAAWNEKGEQLSIPLSKGEQVSSCCYTLQRNEETLWILLGYNGIRVEIVVDENRKTKKEIGAFFDNKGILKIDLRCMFNHMQNACDIHGFNTCKCCCCSLE